MKTKQPTRDVDIADLNRRIAEMIGKEPMGDFWLAPSPSARLVKALEEKHRRMVMRPFRLKEVIGLREATKLTFPQIGQLFGCSPRYADRLYRIAKWRFHILPKKWYCGLSVRATNVLEKNFIDSRKKAKLRFHEGRLHQLRCGKKTLREILLWADALFGGQPKTPVNPGDGQP